MTDNGHPDPSLETVARAHAVRRVAIPAVEIRAIVDFHHGNWRGAGSGLGESCGIAARRITYSRIDVNLSCRARRRAGRKVSTPTRRTNGQRSTAYRGNPRQSQRTRRAPATLSRLVQHLRPELLQIPRTQWPTPLGCHAARTRTLADRLAILITLRKLRANAKNAGRSASDPDHAAQTGCSRPAAVRGQTREVAARSHCPV